MKNENKNKIGYVSRDTQVEHSTSPFGWNTANHMISIEIVH